MWRAFGGGVGSRFVAKIAANYAFPLTLEATGEDYDVGFVDGEKSAGRARLQAIEKLAAQQKHVTLPIPCPECGFYQAEMASALKDAASVNGLQIAGFIALLATFISIAVGSVAAIVVAAIMGVLGVVLLVLGYQKAFRYDPNSGEVDARKAIGRRFSVSGTALVEMMKDVGQTKPEATEG